VNPRSWALAVLILIFGPISGAHFNPIVILVDWRLHRHSHTVLAVPEVAAYLIAQTIGAIGGAMPANLMFSRAPVTFSPTHRSTANLWLGEVVATAGLVLLIFALMRTGRPCSTLGRSPSPPTPPRSTPQPPTPVPLPGAVDERTVRLRARRSDQPSRHRGDE
jgi:glycerol uptake facilitator-like aquaporin